MGETTTYGVRMAKASNEETLVAVSVASAIEDLHKGYHPGRGDDVPLHFDPDDAEHLRALYDRLMELTEPHPGGLGRVAGLAHVVLVNNILDPDDDCVELHPNLRRAAALPEWLAYDAATDTLTVHGKRYAAALLGVNGVAGPRGSLLRIDSEPADDTVVLTRIDQPVAFDAVSDALDRAGVPADDRNGRPLEPAERVNWLAARPPQPAAPTAPAKPATGEGTSA